MSIMTSFSLHPNGGVYFYTKWRLAVSSCEAEYRCRSITAVLWTLTPVWRLKATTAEITGTRTVQQQQQQQQQQ
jgi:hypothetical protein